MAGGATYLITGASRGLGLELVKQYLEGDALHTVIAGARNPSGAEALQQLAKAHEGRLHIIQMDVAKPDSIKEALVAADALLQDGLDYLICNAGVNEGLPRASEETLDALQHTFAINFFGATVCTQVALPLLRRGKKKTVILLSSLAASLSAMYDGIKSDPPSFIAPLSMGYKCSKAALNMMVVTLAADLKAEGFTIVAIHPGWVSTDMGLVITVLLPEGVVPPLTPPESAAAMIKTISGLGVERSGSFVNWEGEAMPW